MSLLSSMSSSSAAPKAQKYRLVITAVTAAGLAVIAVIAVMQTHVQPQAEVLDFQAPAQIALVSPPAEHVERVVMEAAFAAAAAPGAATSASTYWRFQSSSSGPISLSGTKSKSIWQRVPRLSACRGTPTRGNHAAAVLLP